MGLRCCHRQTEHETVVLSKVKNFSDFPIDLYDETSIVNTQTLKDNMNFILDLMNDIGYFVIDRMETERYKQTIPPV